MAFYVDHEAQRLMVTLPQTAVDVQDILNVVREEEASEQGITHEVAIFASGKQSLGEGVAVGLTVELLGNWQIQFEEVEFGGYIAKIAGGNLVGGPGGDPVAYSAGVQVLLIQSAASTIVVTNGEGGTGTGTFTDADRTRLFQTALETTAQTIKARVLQTALETSITDIKAQLDTLAGVIDAMRAFVTDLHDETFGRWVIDFATDSMVMYRPDNTVLKTFSLTRSEETPPTYVGRENVA